jgi:hypothetical protein
VSADGSLSATQMMRAIGTTKKRISNTSAGARSSNPTAADGSLRQARPAGSGGAATAASEEIIR